MSTPLADQLEHMMWLASRFRRERIGAEITPAAVMTADEAGQRVEAHMDIIGTLQWMLANETEVRGYIAQRRVDATRNET